MALGVLGLTSYCRKKMTTAYERAWREAIRRQCCTSVTCEEVSCEEESSTDPAGSNAQHDFSMELLNGPATQGASNLQRELVRLTWANRALIKGRIVVLNHESHHLDSLLRRAAGEEVGGFAFCSKDEQSLPTDQIEIFLQRIRDAFKGSEAAIPPVWLVFGSDVSCLMASDGPRMVRITEVRDFVPAEKEEVFLLPGAGVGDYNSDWVPDVVIHSLCKNETMSTLNSLEGFWSWLNTAEEVIEHHETKQDVAARMRNIELYNETRYLC